MKQKTVALLIDELDGAYQGQLVKGIKTGAHELGLHVLCFPGRQMASTQGFRREFNMLYQLAARYEVQGVVSATGTFTSNLTHENITSYFSKFGGAPIVSIGSASPGIPVIQPDNRCGMVELVDHFIHHHGFTRIAFITGPENNTDAIERLDVFRERHAKAGLPVDEKLIFQGYFDRDSGHRAIETMTALGLQPQAIIAANDEMAVTAASALLKRGLRIPDDIAIAGFDDVSAIMNEGPPLTSVHQATAHHTQLALHALAACWRGTPIPIETRVATRAIVRFSCGCSGLSCGPTNTALWNHPKMASEQLGALRIALQTELAGRPKHFHDTLCEYARKTAAVGSNFNDLRNILLVLHSTSTRPGSVYGAAAGQATALLFAAQLWLIAQENLYVADKVLETAFSAWQDANQLLTGMSSSDVSLGKRLQFLRDTLIHSGTRNAYLVLYPNLGHVREWNDCQLPEEGQLVLAIRDGVALPTADYERFPLKDLLPFPVFHQEGGAVYSVLPLFQQQEHYGYLILDIESTNGMRIEKLREVISNLVVSTIVVGELDRTRQLLKQDLDRVEENNQQLAVLSERDELTGLLNRRGFFARATALRRESDQPLMLISADMDGLKAVNDTWGHAIGDKAIMAMAGVLAAAFRSGDLIARLGGDEFVILSRSFSPEAEARIRKRLAEHIAQHNATHKAGWTLATSLGFVPIPANDKLGFDDRLAMADRLLYEEKRQRKLDKSPLSVSGNSS